MGGRVPPLPPVLQNLGGGVPQAQRRAAVLDGTQILLVGQRRRYCEGASLRGG
jgi:hypothetical protein